MALWESQNAPSARDMQERTIGAKPMPKASVYEAEGAMKDDGVGVWSLVSLEE